MRRLCCLFLLLVFNSSLFSCQENKNQKKDQLGAQTSGTMKVTILNKTRYPNIPSASGLEIVEDKVFVIGDDSPFLYVLEAGTLRLTDKIELFKTNAFGLGRIPKALKPDLECLTTLTMAGEPHLVAFGSGSAPTRTKCYSISIPQEGGPAAEVKEYSLTALYTALQQDKTLLSGDLLNLEAAAATPDNRLFLFQRSALHGPNILLRFNTTEFIRHLQQESTNLPAFETIRFDLPTLSGLKARFSGAYVYQNHLFFTASVENTTDAILDGEVVGSFIGLIDAQDLELGATTHPAQTALIYDATGDIYKGKVESLVIQHQEGANSYRGLAITDNDNGESELLELLITL